MRLVDFAWVVVALPLLAALVNLGLTLPNSVRLRKKDAQATGEEAQDGHDGHDGHGSDALDAAAGHQAHDKEHRVHGGVGAGHDEVSHDEHGLLGGPTRLALAGGWFGILMLVASFALSVALLVEFLQDPNLLHNGSGLQHLYTWFSFGPLQYNIDFRVDTLTVVMLLVVTSVSMLVHLYSYGYMRHDDGFSRFFTELALFTVSMLILVLAANFLVIFIGWELVGLSSYLLIGFWFSDQRPEVRIEGDAEKPYPPPAQLKAFVTTRLGDFGFLIGILILFFQTNTFDFVALNAATLHVDKGIMTLAMVLVFCGAIGKSAQFPLHVWLPDAMAGPTPVSALIHAATMVAAGVYLVARLFPLFAVSAGPQALAVVGLIGAFTALFAASIALTQYDIKGVLAYSTISQLGYMFVGLSVADTNALGMYHLFTHAFFKALLFLGSGSVIIALHHVQNMRRMGGLAKFMPITALCFLVANLAISGIPPFSGFWSKDPIIAAAFERQNYLIYGMTLFTALLTAFYMFRLYFLTFGGTGGAFAGFWGGRDQYRGETQPHESPLVMTLPLMLLAAATIVIGLFGLAGLNEGFAWFLNNGTNVNYPVAPAIDDWKTYAGTGVGVLGILVATAVYGLGWIPDNVLTSNPVGAFVRRVLYHRYYLDELYQFLIRWVVFGLSNLAVWFDAHIIDGIVNGTARSVRGIGNITRRSETGVLQNYGAALFGGTIIILIVIFVAASGIAAGR